VRIRISYNNNYFQVLAMYQELRVSRISYTNVSESKLMYTIYTIDSSILRVFVDSILKPERRISSTESVVMAVIIVFVQNIHGIIARTVSDLNI
jgi:hypothetical protein